MTQNRLKTLKKMVDEAGLEIVEFIDATRHFKLGVRCRAGTPITQIFNIQLREGDPRADKNELARMKRFYREQNPDTALAQALRPVIEKVPELKPTYNDLDNTDWDENALGPRSTDLWVVSEKALSESIEQVQPLPMLPAPVEPTPEPAATPVVEVPAQTPFDPDAEAPQLYTVQLTMHELVVLKQLLKDLRHELPKR